MLSGAPPAEKGLPPRRKGTAAAGAEGRERPVGDTGPYLAAAITMATAGSGGESVRMRLRRRRGERRAFRRDLQ